MTSVTHSYWMALPIKKRVWTERSEWRRECSRRLPSRPACRPLLIHRVGRAWSPPSGGRTFHSFSSAAAIVGLTLPGGSGLARA